IRTWNNVAIVARVVAAPSDRDAGRAILKRLHLGGVGHLAILLVERGADRAADQTAGECTDSRTCDAIAGAAAADRRAENPTHERTGHRAGILLRRRRIRIAGASGDAGDGKHDGNRPEWTHQDPPEKR